MSPCERWCVCICMHRCSHRAGSSLIIGSTQDTWRSRSKSGSYQVGSLEQVLQVRSFCGLSTSVKQEQGILFGVFLCLHSPHMQKIKIGCQLCHHYVLWCLGSVKSALAFYLLHSALSYNSVAVYELHISLQGCWDHSKYTESVFWHTDPLDLTAPIRLIQLLIVYYVARRFLELPKSKQPNYFYFQPAFTW